MAAEEGAHAARRGIWVGEFELPAQWRRERRIDRLLAAPPLTVPTLGAPGLPPVFLHLVCTWFAPGLHLVCTW